MARLIGVLSLLATVAFTAIGGEPDKDMAKFQGKWEIIYHLERGKGLSVATLKSLETTIKDDVLTVRQTAPGKKEKVILEMRIKIDSAMKPKTIDFTHLLGDDKGKTEIGIYDFDGDNLWICTDEDGKKRPTEYESKEGTSYSVVVMKRK